MNFVLLGNPSGTATFHHPLQFWKKDHQLKLFFLYNFSSRIRILGIQRAVDPIFNTIFSTFLQIVISNRGSISVPFELFCQNFYLKIFLFYFSLVYKFESIIKNLFKSYLQLATKYQIN